MWGFRRKFIKGGNERGKKLEIESTFHVRKFAEKIGFKGNLRQIHREAISELISQKRIMVFQEYGLTKYRLILLNEPD
jgi:hypothetical protein